MALDLLGFDLSCVYLFLEGRENMKKTGLILEGGGMRGVFTAGVLDFFLDKKIDFDVCSAVSAGACHACSYLAKQRGRALSTAVDFLDDKDYCTVGSLLRTGDIFGADLIYRKVPLEIYPIDNETFKKNRTEFYSVITDCETGEARYYRINDLIEDVDAVRASASLPFVSRMVEIEGKKYLDGGLSDSIPIKFSEKMGCTRNVLVLTRDKTYRKSPSKFTGYSRLKYKKYPKLSDSIKNRYIVYNKTLDYIDRQEERGRAFVIRPETDLNIGRMEKNRDKLMEAYEKGYRQAEKCYDGLMKYLED